MDDQKKVGVFESLVRSERNGISRREFLRRGLALGLSLPAASGVIATVLGAPVRVFAQDAAATKGGQGTLVVEQSGDPVSFNPNYTIDDFGYPIAFNTHSMLVTLSQDVEVIPDIAESWETSEDGLTITFHLVQNAKWHDGTPVTSADVKWTYEKIVSTEGAPGRDNLIMLESVDTPDDYTAVFNLSSPSSQFLGFLAWYATFLLPKHLYEGTDWSTNPVNQTPIGSGPFKFVEYVAGDHITLEANPDYFGEGPYMDRIVYRIIPDAATLEQAILNDEVDVDISGLFPTDSLANVEADGRFTTVEKVYASNFYIVFNHGRDITGNIEVRRAIGEAIDRAQIVERGLSGAGTPVNTYYTPVISWANNSDATAPDYDPENSKALLDEAGYPVQADGYRFKLSFPYLAFGDAWRSIAQVIQAQLREVGIDSELVELEPSAWNARVATDDNYDITYLAGFLGPGPGALKNRYGTGGGINFWHYSNVEVDKLLDEAASEPNAEEATAKYKQVQALLAEDIASIPFSGAATTFVYRKEISGLPVPGDAAGDILGFGNFALVQRASS
ncbi:MAG: ABC transporter substrate-binding protein [Chloroflexi bacterium]|nr:ABC transporter substrate-binding protein [Chloroflexota bacterium]